MFTKGKHVVLGGLGSVGKIMQSALLSRGLPVCVIDQNVNPTRTKSKRYVRNKQLNQNNNYSSVQYFRHQLGFDDPAELKDMIRGSDTVYNLATPDIIKGTEYDHYQTNHFGVKILIDACREINVPKLVHASSTVVSNQLLPSINQNEESPLPAWDTYKFAYDISKRKGEELVLDANSNGAKSLKTCALRCGAVLADKNNCGFRNFFNNPGKIVSIEGEKIDIISAKDLCKALIKASEKLEEVGNGVAGRALYLTKCRKGESPHSHDIAQKASELLGWPITVIPKSAKSLMHQKITQKKDSAEILSREFGRNINNILLDYTESEKTFDNSMAKCVLDFEPEETWEEAMEELIKEYLLEKNVKAVGCA